MRRGWILVAALVCAALVFAARAANADGTEDGRAHFQRGVEFYKESDFRGALIEFRRAYDAAPNYKVLYNLGQTNLELQDYASALTAFRRYLDEGGKDVPAPRVAQVEGELRKLAGRVAKVRVTTNLGGADLQVDEVTVGKAPATVLVSAGRRKIAVTKLGSPSQSRTVDVAGGDELTVDLEVAPPTPPPPAPPAASARPALPVVVPPPPHVPSTGGGPSAATLVGLVTTGALAAGAGVVGGLALVSKGRYDAAMATPDAEQKIRDARSETRTFALTTDVLAASAVVSAGITLVLALTTHAKRTALPAEIGVGPKGVVFSRAF